MFKFVFSAFICAAMCFPAATAAQDCGCCEPAPAPCVKTRKRLKLVDSTRQVCRAKRVCATDECGCTKSQLVREKVCVASKRLALVDVAVNPCRIGSRLGSLGSRLRGRLGSRGCCNTPAPAPCGCEATPEPCGCGSAAPAASCGCGGAAMPMQTEFSTQAPMQMEYSTEAPMQMDFPTEAPMTMELPTEASPVITPN